MSEVPMTMVEWFVFAERGRYWYNNSVGNRSYDPLPDEVMRKLQLLDAAKDDLGSAHIAMVGDMYTDMHDHEACYIIYIYSYGEQSWQQEQLSKE